MFIKCNATGCRHHNGMDACSRQDLHIEGTNEVGIPFCTDVDFKDEEEVKEVMTNRLTEKDSQGNWGLKGVPWSFLTPGATITKDNFKKLYGALWKLKDYEDTGLSPDEVERISVIPGKWIPVGERLPETSKMVLVIVHSSEWISDYYSDWISEEEKIYHKEEYRTFCGHINESGEWVFFDETMSEVHCSEEFGTDKSVVYDVVTHWKPLPEPYKEGEYD